MKRNPFNTNYENCLAGGGFLSARGGSLGERENREGKAGGLVLWGVEI